MRRVKINLKQGLANIAKSAQVAFRSNMNLSSDAKNEALKGMALGLARRKDYILNENKKDIKEALKGRMPAALIDRLTLTDKRIAMIHDSLMELTKLNDPVGEIIKEWVRPNGLKIRKVRVPIGVIAIIYESRPNVTADCIGLCFKSGNSVILRGGSEALNSNMAIYKIMKDALKGSGASFDALQMVETSDRKAVDALLKLNNHIDLVIPRGGEGLIRRVVKSSLIPVIKHYKGICHVYVDDWADLNMAQNICFNAKVQRPGVCNAMESMLVHKDCAIRFLPGMLKQFNEAGVEIRGCPLTRRIVKNVKVKAASEDDYGTEYLDLILSVKVVDTLEQAIWHINGYGSHHSDTIVTDKEENAAKFLKEVDSACVYVNASTRFTDGYQFGMGAEIGISTDKLHARGPMALEELTTYKYTIFGNGQVRT